MALRGDLENRMKEYYENIPKTKLMRRCPVILRIDGKTFHTFTRNFQKPFDDILIKSMQETMKYLCENIQGCVLGYTQSDEITLVLIDYKKFTSQAWFDYEVQKICSIAASMATMAFNKFFVQNVKEFYNNDENYETNSEEYKLCQIYKKAVEKGAMFDCRCFNIPKEEVTNCIYWRQLDASNNSIQMVGQANFSHNELKNKTCNEVQDMLMVQKGINWNNLPIYQKRGSCCIRNHMVSEPYGNRMFDSKAGEHEWVIDMNIPIFKGEDRKYIDNLVFVGE